MNVALWTVAALLTVAFGAAGALKVSQPKPKLVESGQAWAEDFSPSLVKTIGALEVAAAVGRILPHCWTSRRCWRRSPRPVWCC